MKHLTVLPISLFAFVSSLAQTGWYRLSTEHLPKHVDDLVFISSDVGFITGYNDTSFVSGGTRQTHRRGVVLQTTDGGQNWSELQMPLGSSLAVRFYDIYFRTTREAYIAGAVTDTANIHTLLFHTEDGGSNWQLLPMNLNGYATRVQFPTAQVGFVIADVGRYYNGFISSILKTTDGGTTWKDITPDGSWEYDEVFYRDPDHGMTIQAGNEPWIYRLMRTNNGGDSVTYTGIQGGDWAWLIGLTYISDQTWIVGQYNHVSRTTDDGVTWTRSPILFGSDINMDAIAFYDYHIGYIVSDDVQHIAKTIDGGLTWIRQESNAGDSVRPSWMTHVAAPSEQVAYALGGDSTGKVFLKTVDGGGTGTQIPSGVEEQNLQTNISITPNPVTNILHLTIPISSVERTADILDIFGRIIQRLRVPAGSVSLTVSTGAFSSGTYMLRMESNTLPFIIKH